MDVFELIEAQQKGKENTAPWMVGEQLKDICSKDPAAAAIVAEDLQNPDMSLEKCERQIKAWADKQKKGSCACVPPNVAEEIIRKFYGLGSDTPSAPVTQGSGKILSLEDFI